MDFSFEECTKAHATATNGSFPFSYHITGNHDIIILCRVESIDIELIPVSSLHPHRL